MISHIRGILISKKPGQAVVEANGLAYDISVPLGTFLALPEAQAEVLLFTKLFIREESWDLYGFLSTQERECFVALTSVNRIGPKLGLTIVSALEPGELAKALMTRDLNTFSSIKGIGPKTAERLMLELKDKAAKLAAMAGLNADDLKAEIATGSGQIILDGDDDEAASALINLGYTNAEAQKAVGLAKKETDSEDLGTVLRLALKILTKAKR